MDPWKLPNETLMKELTKRNVSFPATSPKKILVDLYRKHVEKSGSVDKSPNNRASITTIDIYRLTDKELLSELKKHNVSVGPITDTTRSVVQKKLLRVLHGGTSPKTSTGLDVEGDEDDYDDSEAEDDVNDGHRVRFRDEQRMDVDVEEEEDQRRRGADVRRNVNFNNQAEAQELERERKFHYASIVDSEGEENYNADGQSTNRSPWSLINKRELEPRNTLTDNSWTNRSDTSSRTSEQLTSGLTSRRTLADESWSSTSASQRDGKGGARPRSRENETEDKWSTSYSRVGNWSGNPSSVSSRNDTGYSTVSSRTPPPPSTSRNDSTRYSPLSSQAPSSASPLPDKPFVPVWCQLLVLILFAGFLFLVIQNMNESWINPVNLGN